MRLSKEPLFTAKVIQRRVKELADEITRDYGQQELVVLVTLKGAIMFAADLCRALSLPVHLDFVRAKSYRGTLTTGTVEIKVHPEVSLAGKHVLVVEDILDTGNTVAALFDRLSADNPASLTLCTLFDKPSRREIPVPKSYVGFTIDDHFVVGYGLDYEERYRELPAVYTLDGNPE